MDTTKFQAEPCASLTDAQTGELGLQTPGSQGGSGNNTSCVWRTADEGGVQLIWRSGGIDTIHEAHERGDLKFFQPLPDVEGLPAVAASRTDGRKSGLCMVHIGTSDQVMLTLSVQQSRGNVGTSDPCEVAVHVAGQVLATIKAG